MISRRSLSLVLLLLTGGCTQMRLSKDCFNDAFAVLLVYDNRYLLAVLENESTATRAKSCLPPATQNAAPSRRQWLDASRPISDLEQDLLRQKKNHICLVIPLGPPDPLLLDKVDRILKTTGNGYGRLTFDKPVPVPWERPIATTTQTSK